MIYVIGLYGHTHNSPPPQTHTRLHESYISVSAGASFEEERLQQHLCSLVSISAKCLEIILNSPT